MRSAQWIVRAGRRQRLGARAVADRTQAGNDRRLLDAGHLRAGDGEAATDRDGADRVEGYDLETGENLWWIGKQGNYPIGSPVLFGDIEIAGGMGGETAPYPT